MRERWGPGGMRRTLQNIQWDRRLQFDVKSRILQITVVPNLMWRRGGICDRGMFSDRRCALKSLIRIEVLPAATVHYPTEFASHALLQHVLVIRERI